MSQETLEEIAKRIENHRLLEESKKIINKAIARYKTKYSGEDKQIWLTNAENNGGYRIVENITGSAAGIAAGAATTLTEDGYTVYKNSRLGELLIGNYAGTYNYRAPKKDIEVEIFNSAAYMPDANDLARDIMIRIADEVQSYSYSNLSEILHRVELIDNELKDLVIERENERDAMASQALLEKINAKENERMAAFQQMQSFVRQTAQLRYQPILDPIQEKIKRLFPYQKDLIIDGGPGTGKTTALIQRIKFLTSYSIEEYLDPGVNLAKITDKKKSWIFFCPNELLSLYLRNSMVEEGLEATDERVKVWSDYKKKLLRGYRLVNSDTKKPFLIYNHSEDTLLFRNQRTAIDGISEDFEDFIVKQFSDRLLKVLDIDIAGFEWEPQATEIREIALGKGEIKSALALASLFSSVNRKFGDYSKSIGIDLKKKLDLIASRVQVITGRNEDSISQIKRLFAEWAAEAVSTDEDIDDAEAIENEDAPALSSTEFDSLLLSRARSCIRKIALMETDKTTSLSKREKQLSELLNLDGHKDEIKLITPFAVFNKYFSWICQGSAITILRSIPQNYKRFRRKALESKTKIWDLNLLEILVKKDENKRLHADEQAFVISFINSMITALLKSHRKQLEDANHPFVNSYFENARCVIGVDEATDFPLVDLIAMKSFSDKEISSITYSGDVMQSMTNNGIISWDGISGNNAKVEVMTLETSYRQSPTLLDLASAIYFSSTGKHPSYKSFLTRDPKEPKPIAFENDDETEKIQWIGSRILEIYTAYGQSIPSIAIFVPSEDQLELVARQLGSLDSLADIGISVVPCRDGKVLGDRSTVRVFCVKVIKGLEFEAVFFHNMHECVEKYSEEMVARLMYVGISRATFYLGITSTNPLKDYFQWHEHFMLGQNGYSWSLE